MHVMYACMHACALYIYVFVCHIIICSVCVISLIYYVSRSVAFLLLTLQFNGAVERVLSADLDLSTQVNINGSLSTEVILSNAGTHDCRLVAVCASSFIIINSFTKLQKKQYTSAKSRIPLIRCFSYQPVFCSWQITP